MGGWTEGRSEENCPSFSLSAGLQFPALTLTPGGVGYSISVVLNQRRCLTHEGHLAMSGDISEHPALGVGWGGAACIQNQH